MAHAKRGSTYSMMRCRSGLLGRIASWRGLDPCPYALNPQTLSSCEHGRAPSPNVGAAAVVRFPHSRKNKPKVESAFFTSWNQPNHREVLAIPTRPEQQRRTDGHFPNKPATSWERATPVGSRMQMRGLLGTRSTLRCVY